MIHIVFVVLGLAALYAGADLAVRGASSLGLRFGLSPVIVGLTIVAYGTSAPELVVSTTATLQGQDGIALANVVGSNICNSLLVLGVCALIRPMASHARVLRVEAPLLVVVSALAFGLLVIGDFGRLAGGALVAGLVAYTIVTVRLARAEAAEVEQKIGDGLRGPTASSRLDLGLAGAGFALLVVGGGLLVRGASGGAAALGVPPSVVGLSLVALGTSLPELATSTLAAARGQGDIAIGNVVGSNLFNLLGVLGFAALVDPISAQGIGGRELLVMFASSVALLAFMYTDRRLARWEGALLVLGYAAWMYSLAP
jgi:cation:H+ antiporter